jgi:hypothetical protein
VEALGTPYRCMFVTQRGSALHLEDHTIQPSCEAQFVRELEEHLAEFIVTITAPVFFDLALTHGRIQQTQDFQIRQLIKVSICRRIRGATMRRIALAHQIDPWAMECFCILLEDHKKYLSQIPLFMPLNPERGDCFTGLEWPSDLEIQNSPENAHYAFIWLLEHLQTEFRMIMEDLEVRDLLPRSVLFAFGHSFDEHHLRS